MGEVFLGVRRIYLGQYQPSRWQNPQKTGQPSGGQSLAGVQHEQSTEQVRTHPLKPKIPVFCVFLVAISSVRGAATAGGVCFTLLINHF